MDSCLKKIFIVINVMVLMMAFPICASEKISLWDMEKLSCVPEVESAENIITSAKNVRYTEGSKQPPRPEGVRAIWLDGPEYQGKLTKIFAWVGLPEKTDGNFKVPAMVLVHGGGGTAFAHWVAMWNRLGYAAIAIDTSGRTPTDSGYYGHKFAGPRGCEDFASADKPAKEQWAYHAVSAIIIAHSYIRSLDGVDPNRTGLTGISWGGFLTCIAASVDNRFRFAIPVYGCGFLSENSAWVDRLNAVGKEKRDRWLSLWDPSVYIDTIKMPIFWVAYTNDTAYPMDSLQKSYRLLKNKLSLCVLVNFGHSHACGWSRPEIAAFAESIFNPSEETALPVITGQGRQGQIAWVKFSHVTPVKQAQLCYTKDSGSWAERRWQIITLPLKNDRRLIIKTKLPEGVRAYYFNIVDDRSMIISSQHEEL